MCVESEKCVSIQKTCPTNVFGITKIDQKVGFDLSGNIIKPPLLGKLKHMIEKIIFLIR